MPQDSEPSLYSLGVQIAHLEGKIDGYQQTAVARELLLSTRLDESRIDREKIHAKLDELDKRQDGFDRWRNRVVGGLGLMALLLVALAGTLLPRVFNWKP